MSVTADVTKRGRTIRENVTITVPSVDTVSTEARKPLFASLGVVDLAVERAKSAPGTVKALPAVVRSQVGSLQEKGAALYGELVVRGEKLVTSVRKQPSTQAAEKAAGQAVRSAKGTATSTRKAVKATGQAVEDGAEKIG